MEGKKMRMNVLLTSNSGQIDSQKGVLRSCCKSPLLWKKNWLSNWVFDGMGLGAEGGCRRLSIFGEERRHSKPRSQQCLAD